MPSITRRQFIAGLAWSHDLYVMYPIVTSQTLMKPDSASKLRTTLLGCRSKGVGTLNEAEIAVHQGDMAADKVWLRVGLKGDWPGGRLMAVSLRQFEPEDLAVYERWRAEINAGQYMSRFWPRTFEGQEVERPGLYAWYVIVFDGVDVGTVWLEKDRPRDTVATLGILIGRRERLGTGIGREAIRLAIAQARERLGFDTVRLNVRETNGRAIACYRRCGFEVIRRGRKLNPQGEEIAFFEMRLRLDT